MSKSSRWLLLAGVAAAIGGALVVSRPRGAVATAAPPAVETSGIATAAAVVANRPAEGIAPRRPDNHAPSRAGEAPPQGQTRPQGIVPAQATQPEASPRTFRAAQVVATLNGTAIKGTDVVAFPAGRDEQSLEASSYDALLQRAVDRELTFEAAKKQGVSLTDPQRAQLDEVRKQAAARGSTTPPFVPTRDEVNLEVRDAEANLLQTDLLAKAGTPPPGSVEQQQSWAAKRRAMLDDLKAQASLSY